MASIHEDELLKICKQLEPVLEDLASIQERMEQRTTVSVDNYFDILFSFERINEAKERLGKVAEKQKQEADNPKVKESVKEIIQKRQAEMSRPRQNDER